MLMTKYIFQEQIVNKDSQMISIIKRKRVHYSPDIYMSYLRFLSYSYALRYILIKENYCLLNEN